MNHERWTACVLAALCGLAMTAPTSHAAPAPGDPDAPAPTTLELRDGLARPRPAAAGLGATDLSAAGSAAGSSEQTAALERALATAAQRASGKGSEPLTLARAAQTRGDCTPTDLAAGQTNGELRDGDCRWGQLTGLADVSLVDVYRLRLPALQRVRVSASSAAFAVLLSLRDARYRPIVDAAAEGGAASAAIDVVLPAGTYYVFATNAGAGPVATGAYRLDATLSAEDAPSGCSPIPMGVGTPQAGTLGASGCRGYDYLPHLWLTGDAAMYVAELDTAGILTLQVAATGHVPPRLSVLTRTGLTSIDATFGASDPAAATRLDVALPAGHFLVFVYADTDEQAGAFSLTSSFASAAAACAAVPAAAGTDIAATLDGGCRLAHVYEGDYSGNAVDLYALTVTQDSIVTIHLATQGFHAHMYLLDPFGRNVAEGGWVDDGFKGALGPGTYNVGVFAESTAVGDYVLSFDVQAMGEACQVQPLGWGSPIAGSIDPTDCAMATFNLIYDGYDRAIDVYVLDVPARGEVDIQMSSTAIDPYLILLGGPYIVGGELQWFGPSNDDYDLVLGTDARVKIPVWPGRYLVGALDSPFADMKGAGAYRLEAQFTPQAAPGCANVPLGPNAQISAELAGTECRAFDRDRTRTSASLQDRYVLDIPTTGVLTVRLNAPSFSPRIQLSSGPYGDPIGADYDPNQARRDAMLQFVAEPGTYWLDVEAVVRGRTTTGAYTLETTFQPRPTCEAITDLDPLPADRTGQITADDCILGDAPLHERLTQFIDYYRFTLSEVGELTIDLTSDQIDPFLTLIDARWEPFASHSNLDEFDANSQLHFDQLMPGTYIVGAISTNPGQLGAYRLKVAFEPSPLLVPTPGPSPSATRTTPAPTPAEPTPTASGTPSTGNRIYLPYGSRLVRLR